MFTKNQNVFHFIHRYRLTSASDEEDFEDDASPLFDDYEEHLQYMAARERLQEFPGRIPPRKKRDQTSNTNDQTRKTRVSSNHIFFSIRIFPCQTYVDHVYSEISFFLNKNFEHVGTKRCNRLILLSNNNEPAYNRSSFFFV